MCVLRSHEIIIAFAHQHEVSDSGGRARATFNTIRSREERGFSAVGGKLQGTAKTMTLGVVEFVSYPRNLGPAFSLAMYDWEWFGVS